jgi:hypothetical protein
MPGEPSIGGRLGSYFLQVYHGQFIAYLEFFELTVSMAFIEIQILLVPVSREQLESFRLRKQGKRF